MKLFSNGFSPFARKVALVLDYKGLEYETVDGLARQNHASLLALNPRAEVPALVDGDITVVNSSDIVAYLDQKYPERPVYPATLKDKVEARAIERLADTRIDAIMLDCSIWLWADRKDTPPAGLIEAGQRDLDTIFARLEDILAAHPSPLPYAHWTIAEFALWPHLAALRALGLSLSPERFPRLSAWFGAMRRDRLFLADAKRASEFVKSIPTNTSFEREKIFWRGDRVEWLLARGFHDWFFEEIRAGRTLWPE